MIMANIQFAHAQYDAKGSSPKTERPRLPSTYDQTRGVGASNFGHR